MKVVNVRINGMENPVGFDFETVCVSWKVRETSARRQQNVKIEIALTEDFSELLWTKEGKNLNSAAEKLEFEQSAYTRYYVRVTVTSDEGETAVSKPAYFETGKMDDPWMGKWITTKKEDTMVSHTCGIFFYYVNIFTFQTPIFCFLQARASLSHSLLPSP